MHARVPAQSPAARRGVPTRPLVATALVALALVLLLSFQTPDQLETRTGLRASGSAAPIPSTVQAKTVTGPVINTRWGPVQVQVIIEGRRITTIKALQLPEGGRSGRISDRVEPILRSEALAAQGADIDNVSGATYTTNAYAQSLQAALDSAGG